MEEQRQENEEMEIDLLVLLQDFFRGIRKFWWLVVVLALAGGLVMYVRSSGYYTPMYRSEATFTVTTSTSGGSDGSYNYYYDSSTADQLAKTFPYILSSDLLTDAMKEDLGTETIMGSVSAQTISQSNMVTMSAVSSDPEEAKRILESAIRVYPDVARFVIGDTKFYMIDPPNLPDTPFNQPSYRSSVEKGILIGAAAGMAWIILYAVFRKTVHRQEELKQVLNLNCLASLPKVRHKMRRKAAQSYPSIQNRRINPWFAENMETLQIRIARELEERKGKVLLVTSTISGEGKSVVSMNLAYQFAEHGKKVLLIDADLRKQQLAEQIKAKGAAGLSQVVSGETDWKKAVTHLEDSGIWFLGGTKRERQTAAVLSSPAFVELMEQAREEMDYIILDAPPSEGFEDVLLLREYADGVVYVIMQDYVQKRRILDSVSVLDEEDGKLLGYVFNGVSGITGGYGYYGYGRYGRYGRYGKYSYYRSYYGNDAEHKTEDAKDEQKE